MHVYNICHVLTSRKTNNCDIIMRNGDMLGHVNCDYRGEGVAAGLSPTPPTM